MKVKSLDPFLRTVLRYENMGNKWKRERKRGLMIEEKRKMNENHIPKSVCVCVLTLFWKTSLNLCPVSRLTTEPTPSHTLCTQITFSTVCMYHKTAACISKFSQPYSLHITPHMSRDCRTNAIAYWINTHLSQRNLGITPFIIKIPLSLSLTYTFVGSHCIDVSQQIYNLRRLILFVSVC